VEIQRRPWKKYSLIQFIDFLSKSTQSAEAMRVSQINSSHTALELTKRNFNLRGRFVEMKNLDIIRLIYLKNVKLIKKIGVTTSVITFYMLSI
jgi:hypothetical protein